ncbi:MAG: hypothetical protein OCU12_07245 [Methanophagales archaeon]|nr:hypothetical protein [Methanophagales archaeon]
MKTNRTVHYDAAAIRFDNAARELQHAWHHYHDAVLDAPSPDATASPTERAILTGFNPERQKIMRMIEQLFDLAMVCEMAKDEIDGLERS